MLTLIFIVTAKTNLPNFKTDPCSMAPLAFSLSPASYKTTSIQMNTQRATPTQRVIQVNALITISDLPILN